MATQPGGGEVVLPCPDLDDAMAFFTERLGFRLETIMPADRPSVAVVSGHGLRLRLTGPVDAGTDPPPVAPAFEITRAADGAGGTGRAGMRYRDLLPSRRAGHVIASHITIDEAGPVPDYVHHHDVRFQVIYCRRGWVRVVYEDQGPPFVIGAGDCVLQPPGIRHRVLESSPGLEVVEVTSPAEHATHVDHDLGLPTSTVRPERTFGDGQRFVLHRAAGSAWEPWEADGFEVRRTGVGAATGGVADVVVVRAARPGASTGWRSFDGDLALWFVTDGSATLRLAGREDVVLGPGDAVAVASGLDHDLAECSNDLQVLVVTAPGPV